MSDGKVLKISFMSYRIRVICSRSIPSRDHLQHVHHQRSMSGQFSDMDLIVIELSIIKENNRL